MCYYIRRERKKICYLVWSVICTRRKNIGTVKEYVNNDTKYAPELEEMQLGLLNTANNTICEYHKYKSTPVQDVDLRDMGYVDNKVEIYSGMDISDNDDTKDSGEVEIH